MADEGICKILKVALGVCIFCSVFVATAAVGLKGIQERNKKLDKVKNILLAGDLYTNNEEIEKIYTDYIEPVMIDLTTGEAVGEEIFNDKFNIETFDIKVMAKDPEYGQAIPAEQDLAHIKRRPKYMVVYLVKKDDAIDKIILPMYGKGLWSTMYGFLALGSDLKTIRGLTFYEHGETPGLGGEIENPRWRKTWDGKLAFGDAGNVTITVIKGKVVPGRPEASHQVDGLSGATITTRGVDQLMKYWLGENGYGPFLSRMRRGNSDEQV